MVVPVAIGFYLSVVFAVFSLKMWGGARYAYAPSVLLFVFFVNLYPLGSRLSNITFSRLRLFLVAATIPEFFNTKKFYDPGWERFSVENAHLTGEGEVAITIFPQSSDRGSWQLKVPLQAYRAHKY